MAWRIFFKWTNHIDPHPPTDAADGEGWLIPKYPADPPRSKEEADALASAYLAQAAQFSSERLRLWHSGNAEVETLASAKEQYPAYWKAASVYTELFLRSFHESEDDAAASAHCPVKDLELSCMGVGFDEDAANNVTFQFAEKRNPGKISHLGWIGDNDELVIRHFHGSMWESPIIDAHDFDPKVKRARTD